MDYFKSTPLSSLTSTTWTVAFVEILRFAFSCIATASKSYIGRLYLVSSFTTVITPERSSTAKGTETKNIL